MKYDAKQTVWMMKGLPGSGKSTRARQMMEKNPGLKRVCKDDIRAMIHTGNHSGPKEKLTKKVRDAIIVQLLQSGHSVVVDDTNLYPGHCERLRQLAMEHGAAFQVVDLTDVPLNVCIANDLKRATSVGEGVIRQMHDNFLAPPKVEIDTSSTAKPIAALVDLDGTIAINNSGRSPFDWAGVGEDDVNTPVEMVVNALLVNGMHILFVSGRESVCYPETKKWLDDVFPGQPNELYMRPAGDTREDSVVKLEILDNDILPHYQVAFCIDDRRSVVDAYRSRGITVLDVADGRF